MAFVLESLIRYGFKPEISMQVMSYSFIAEMINNVTCTDMLPTF